MRRALGLVAICLLQLLPGAAATTVEGALTVTRFDGPAGTAFDGQPLALYVGDAAHVQDLTLTAPRATVYYFHREYWQTDARISLQRDGGEEFSYEATNVTIRLDVGDHAGMLGAYFRSGGGQIQFVGDRRSLLEPHTQSKLGDQTADETEPEPDELTYTQTVSIPHALVRASGNATYRGAFALKIGGPEVVVHSEENVTRFSTGRHFGEGTGVRSRTEKWAFVEVPEGTLTLTTRSPLEFALPVARLSWDGEAKISVRSGILQGDATTYEGRGVASLSGTFEGVGLPHADAAAGPTLTLNLEGNLVSTSLESSGTTPVPVTGPSSASWLLLVGLAAATGGAVAVASFAARRRGAEPEFALEECVERAGIAAENEEFGDALAWTERALARAPRSARLHADRGFFLARLGRVDEALSAYGDASDLSADGEAAFAAARVLVLAGRPAEEARPWIEAALARSPDLVLEMDESFAPLRHLPWLRQAQRRAMARLEGHDPNG